MPKKAVLAVGLDPDHADFSRLEGLTPEIVRAYLRQQTDRVRDMGFAVVDCLISPDEAGERALADALAAQHFDCVVIGAGLRQPPALLHLFERVLNTIHAHAPDARLCFNTSPADTAEAVQRWIGG